MDEMDLSNAIEEAARALDPDVFDASDLVPTVGFAREEAREDARRALAAALPHILEALLSMAEEEQREQDEYDPYVAVEAVQFLTARIEDLGAAHD